MNELLGVFSGASLSSISKQSAELCASVVLE